MRRSSNATQRRMNQIHEDDLKVADDNPTNMDLKRQLDMVDKNNTREHQELKDAINNLSDRFGGIEKLAAAHEQTLYGREGEGGLMREHATVKADIVATNNEITATKIGGALAALAITVGIIVAKIEKVI
jgi:hypothetical protein